VPRFESIQADIAAELALASSGMIRPFPCAIDGRADVSRLAGFLRDDDLISHNGSFGRIDEPRTYGEQRSFASHTPSQLYPT
jgi:hypothetical protein